MPGGFFVFQALEVVSKKEDQASSLSRQAGILIQLIAL
jgi:hypothetical protein